MKHLFHIHSNTCYLVALGIVEKKKINFSDVIFFIFRNLPALVKDIQHVHINDDLYYFPYFTNKQLFNFKFIKSRRTIHIIDNIIDENVKENYFYYAHNSRHYLNSVFLSHPLCQQIEFLEDGLDMYLDKYHYEKKYPYRVRLRHKILNLILGKILGSQVFKRIQQFNDPFKNKGGTKTFYGLTDSTFSNIIDHDSKYLKVDEFKSIDIPTLVLPHGSNLYLFSALVEQNIASHNEVNKFLECFVKKFDIQELYINFHPHQSETTREIIIKKLKSSCNNLIIIPDNIMIEKLLMSNTQINIYGIGTSLLIYGTFFSKENNVFALSNYFSEVIGRQTKRTKYWNNTFNNIDRENFYIV